MVRIDSHRINLTSKRGSSLAVNILPGNESANPELVELKWFLVALLRFLVGSPSA